MKVAILSFGQFRSANVWFEPNLIQLKQAFPSDTEFSAYILTDKDHKGCYTPVLESTIKETLAKHSIQTPVFEFWEDQTSAHAMDSILAEAFQKKAEGQPGYLYNAKFNASLWYRRYILWKLFEAAKQEVDWIIFCRLFDTQIEFLRPIQPLLHSPTAHETLFGSIDTFFLGKPLIMKKLLAFGAHADSWQPFEWTPEFQRDFAEFDAVLASTKPTFSSEVQIYRYIKQNIPNWMSIRYDFSVPHGQSPSHSTAYLRSQVQRYKPIPERICQIALGESYRLTLPLTQMKDNLLRSNPNYEYTLLTEQDADTLLKEYPDYAPLYTSLERIQYKSDCLRYLWLHKYGGYYIDIDTLPLLPLWTIYEKTENSEFFASIGAYTNSQREVYEVHNGFLASAPGNPLFLQLLDVMKQEPNPSDYGANVKRLWRTIQASHSMKPYQNESMMYLFEEKEVQREKFCICFHNEVIAIGNGMGYPGSA
jgi:hypothetical protein